MQAPEPDDASSDLARGDRMVQSSNPDGMAFALTYGRRAENGARLARAIFARQWNCQLRSGGPTLRNAGGNTVRRL